MLQEYFLLRNELSWVYRLLPSFCVLRNSISNLNWKSWIFSRSPTLVWETDLISKCRNRTKSRVNETRHQAELRDNASWSVILTEFGWNTVRRKNSTYQRTNRADASRCLQQWKSFINVGTTSSCPAHAYWNNRNWVLPADLDISSQIFFGQPDMLTACFVMSYILFPVSRTLQWR